MHLFVFIYETCLKATPHLTSIPIEADNNCDCVSKLQLSEKRPLSCLFSQSHVTIIPLPYMWELRGALHVHVCVYFCKCLCACVCVITHAVISSKLPFTPAEMKGFPLSQSSFFVSMVLWFCQNPRENRGGRKKINVPHHRQQSLPSGLPPFKSTRQHMHTRTVGGTNRRSCPCDLNLCIKCISALRTVCLGSFGY